MWLTRSPFLHRRPADLSASGASCPLLCRDQIPEIRWGPPSVDHRHCRKRKPHRTHHRQTTDHRGGTTSSHAERQPDSRCDLLIRLCITDRKPPKPLQSVCFRHINYKTILRCLKYIHKIVCTQKRLGWRVSTWETAPHSGPRGVSSPSGLKLAVSQWRNDWREREHTSNPLAFLCLVCSVMLHVCDQQATSGKRAIRTKTIMGYCWFILNLRKSGVCNLFGSFKIALIKQADRLIFVCPLTLYRYKVSF